MNNVSNEIISNLNYKVRRGFNSNVNKQLDEIESLIEKVRDKGIDVDFDNSYPNHYKLVVNNQEYEFNLYRDIKNTLLIVLSII